MLNILSIDKSLIDIFSQENEVDKAKIERIGKSKMFILGV